MSASPNWRRSSRPCRTAAEDTVGRLAERAGTDAQVVWVDYIDYVGPLLAPGGIPWTDEAAMVALYRKAQGLLGSDVITLPLWPLACASMAHAPGLMEQMHAKKRSTHPLRCLLASEALRESSLNIAKALRSVYADAILALCVPSPRLAIVLAARENLREADGLVVGEDEVDSAALYMADFLRVFSEAGVDVLLLQESAQTDPPKPKEIEWYRPLLNVAAHYRWDVGLQLARTGAPAHEVPVDFIIDEQASTVVRFSRPRPGGQVPGFRYLRVPPDSAPEEALQRLRAIRSSTAN